MFHFFYEKLKFFYKHFTLKLSKFLAILIFTFFFNSSFSSTEKFLSFTTPEIVNNQGIIFTNFPNPFKDLTFIYVWLPQKSDCQIKIFDLFGNKVKEFFLEGSENYLISWNARNDNFFSVSAGGYLCVLYYDGKKYLRKIGIAR